MGYDTALAQAWAVLMRGFMEILAVVAGTAVLIAAGWGLVPASSKTVRPRQFWCPGMRRDVEVAFEESGPPGFRRALRVVECSAFECKSAVSCQRRCLDPTRRPPFRSPSLGLGSARVVYDVT